LPGIGKIQAMLTDILFVFLAAPLKFQDNSLLSSFTN
jgi:hypothetical protein